MSDLTEIRCKGERGGQRCNDLLAAVDHGLFEIKCHRCKYLNKIKVYKRSLLTDKPQ